MARIYSRLSSDIGKPCYPSVRILFRRYFTSVPGDKGTELATQDLLLIRVIVGDRYLDKATNISDEINAALRVTPSDNIVDMCTLTKYFIFICILLKTDKISYVTTEDIHENLSGDAASTEIY